MVTSKQRSALGFARRLAEALADAGIPDDRQRRRIVSKRWGVSQEMVRKWLGGKAMPVLSRLTVMATDLGVNVEWLAAGTLPKRAATPSSEDGDWPNIAAFSQPASLGSGAEPEEWAEAHKLKFRADSLRRKHLRSDRLAVCYGAGDSMLPRIKSGDAILFDRSDTEPKDGRLYVVTYDRQLLAKRLVNLGGRWFIESLNREHPKWAKPEPIDEHKGFEVHGRVRWIGSWED